MTTMPDTTTDKPARTLAPIDPSILSDMRANFRRSADAESQLRERMLADLRFSANISGYEQWDPAAVTARKADGRPIITVDRISQPIYSLVNLQRGSGEAIHVLPVDHEADPETAEVIQGVVRNIETQSRAKLAYTWAFEGAVRMGRGFVRILPEYVCTNGQHRHTMACFNQDLRIRRVLNPFSIYPGYAVEPDYSDMRVAFAIEDLTPAEYRAAWGKESAVVGLSDFASLGDQAGDWYPNGHIRIAEYYWVESSQETLIAVRDNTGASHVILERDIRNLQAALGAHGAYLMPSEPQRRPIEIRQIKWQKVNGFEVLQSRDVPGRWIPIVPVIGEEVFVNGEHDYRGIVRGAKETITAYHFQVTKLIEAVDLIPRSNLIISAGQLAGYEKFWKNANSVNYAYLVYNAEGVGTRMVPPPQRLFAAPDLGPLVAAIVQMDNDIKASTRFFDASLGQRGPQESGRAIQRRQEQGDIATSHFASNFRDISLHHIGRILVDQIPFYYDAPRIARIVGLDEQEQTVTLNAPFTDQKGVERVFRLDTGIYDVTIMPGPGYATKQQETRETLGRTLEAVPQMFPDIADLYFKAMGQYDLAKRFEKLLRPELREGQEGQPEIPPEVKQQLDALMAQHQQLVEQLTAAKDALGAQQAKADVEREITLAELASKERIAGVQDRTAREAIDSRELIANWQVEQKHAQAILEAKLAAQDAQLKELELLLKAQIEELKLTVQQKEAAANRTHTENQGRFASAQEDRQRTEDQRP